MSEKNSDEINPEQFIEMNKYQYIQSITIKSIQNINTGNNNNDNEFLRNGELLTKIDDQFTLKGKLLKTSELFNPSPILILINYLKNSQTSISVGPSEKDSGEELSSMIYKVFPKGLNFQYDIDESLFIKSSPGVLSGIFKYINIQQNQQQQKKKHTYNFSKGIVILLEYYRIIIDSFTIYHGKSGGGNTKDNTQMLSMIMTQLKKVKENPEIFSQYKNFHEGNYKKYEEILKKINEYQVVICTNYLAKNFNTAEVSGSSGSLTISFEQIEDFYYGFGNLLLFIDDNKQVFGEDIVKHVEEAFFKFFKLFSCSLEQSQTKSTYRLESYLVQFVSRPNIQNKLICKFGDNNDNISNNLQIFIQKELNTIEREIIKIVLYSTISTSRSEISAQVLLQRLFAISRNFLTSNISYSDINEKILDILVLILTTTRDNNCENSLAILEMTNNDQNQGINFILKIENLMIKELSNFLISNGPQDSPQLLLQFTTFLKSLQKTQKVFLLKTFQKKLIILIENLTTNPEYCMKVKLENLNKAYLLEDNKSGLKALLKSNINKFCGFEDLTSYLYISNFVIRDLFETSTGQKDTNDDETELLDLYYKTQESLSAKYLNYYISRSYYNTNNGRTIKEIKQILSIQSFFYIQKWLYCYNGFCYLKSSTGVKNPERTYELNRILKYNLIQYCLNIHSDSVVIRNLLNDMTILTLSEKFGVTKFELIVSIHSLVLNTNYMNLINSQTHKDRLYNSIILENGLAFITGVDQPSADFNQQELIVKMENLYVFLLKVLEYLVDKQILMNDLRDLMNEYKKDSLLANDEHMCYYRSIILIIEYVYKYVQIYQENSQILDQVMNISGFLKTLRKLALKLTDFLNLDNQEASLSAMTLLQKCLLITRNRNYEDKDSQNLSSEIYKKDEYLAYEPENCVIPDLSAVIFLEVLDSVIFLKKLFTIKLKNRNITIQKSRDNFQTVFTIKYKDKITDIEFSVSQSCKEWFIKNLETIEKDTRDIDQNSTNSKLNSSIMTVLDSTIYENIKHIFLKSKNKKLLQFKHAALLILIQSDYDSIEGLKFVHKNLEIFCLLKKDWPGQDNDIEIDKEVIDYIIGKYQAKQKFMQDQKEYTSAVLIVQSINDLLNSIKNFL